MLNNPSSPRHSFHMDMLIHCPSSQTNEQPKPIIYSHDTIARNIGLYSLKAPEGFETVHKMYEGKRMFVAFPPFHVCTKFTSKPVSTSYYRMSN